MQKPAGLLISCTVLSAACALEPVSGSGTIRSEARPVSGISAVSLSGSGRLVIEQTGTESLTVTTDDNLLPHIRTEVTGNRLEISRDPMTSLRPTQDIVFTLTVKSLEGVDVSGSGRIEAKGLDSVGLAIAISGSGEVSAQGTSDDLALNISGSGQYQGDQMKVRTAAVNISGSGGALVAADEEIDANVSGSGSIVYVGDPRVTQHVSGSGSVRRR